MDQDRLKQRSSEHEMTEENFLKDLYTFMKQRDTPVERIPHLGFKQIDLFLMYKTVKDLGGYQQVTAHQLWKKVYNILGGNPRSTSAATCTRRHYEKLLLPFECHKTGYSDNIIFRAPQTQKRFHPSSYDQFEQEYYRAKQTDYRHIAEFPQNSPTMFVEHQRQIFSFPFNIPPYFPPGSSSLPNYIPYRDPALHHLVLDLHDQPPQTAAEVQTCRQSLDRLRCLAKEFTSSAGWEEPLNLSQKENTLDTLSDAPSSFRPPASKKPMFLNKASLLYSSQGQSTEDEADQAETVEKTSKGHSLTSKSDNVIDLTSSSGANPFPRRAGQPSVHLFNSRSHNTETSAGKPEQDLHQDEYFRMNGPNSELLHQSGHQALDSNSNMEIQVPLKVFQEFIRRGLLSSPAFSGHRLMSPDPSKAEASPEPIRSHSKTSESSIARKEPEDLSFKTPLKKPLDTNQQDSSIKRQRSFGGTEEIKPQGLSSHVRIPLDWNTTSSFSSPKPVHVSVTRNQELMSPTYSEDSPVSLTMKSGTKSDKVTETFPVIRRENSSSPPLLHVTSDQQKFLLANLLYRLQRGPTF